MAQVILGRLIEIDDLTRPDHRYLNEDDKCAYFIERTVGRIYDYSPGNDFINNFKKPPESSNEAELRYKRGAIREAARAIGAMIRDEQFSTLTFVPIPPSAVRGDDAFDNRMIQVCEMIEAPEPVDVREIIVQNQTRDRQHVSGVRLSPDEHQAIGQ